MNGVFYMDLTFEEWVKKKQEEDRKITHNAEVVSLKTDGLLFDLQAAILKECFDDKHLATYHKMYFIPPDLDCGGVGLYGYQRIMISKPYWKEHGIDNDTISTMFHELVHAWDDIKGIKDTDGDYHNAAFKQTCEDHKGFARFTDSENGFNDAHPTEETIRRIKELIKKKR